MNDRALVVELHGREASAWWDCQPGTFDVFAESTLTRDGEDEDSFDLFFDPVTFTVERQEIAPGVIVREGSLSEEPGGEWICKDVATIKPVPAGLLARLQGAPGEPGLWGVPMSSEEPAGEPTKIPGAVRVDRANRGYLYEVGTYEGSNQVRLKGGEVITPEGTAPLQSKIGEGILLSIPQLTPIQRQVEDAHARAAHEREAARQAVAARWNAADRALALSLPGAKRMRLATGFAKIDAATRGGFPVGSLVVVGGAPGAGKTTWLVQTAYRYAVAGYHVAILAIDENADDIMVRLGQMMGFARAALEDRDADTLRAVAAKLRDMHLMLIDGDEDGCTVEDVSAELARRAAGAPSVLCVDSLQKIWFPLTDARSRLDNRARLDAATHAVKGAARTHLVMATSELTRGSYRSQVSAEQVNDLAAFKESGGIEYAAQFAMVLRSRKGSNAIDVTIPKNRLGPKCEGFPLELDEAHATLFESMNTKPPEEEEEERKLAPHLAKVRAYMRAHAGRGLAKTYIMKNAGGAEARIRAAIEWMLDHGELGYDAQGQVRDAGELPKGPGVAKPGATALHAALPGPK